MLYTIAKCDGCKESMLQLDFERSDETILDLLEAAKNMGWKVDVLPGPVYNLRCKNCQNITPEEYTSEVVKGHDGKTKLR